MNPEKTNYEHIPNLVHNSITYLQTYRNNQAKKLKIRLDVLTKDIIDKYGSINNITSDSCLAIESQKDIDTINKLIELETFVIVPNYTDDNEYITHFYTIGMWYYWGIPEMVFKFDSPIKENAEFISLIVNLIHDKVFAMYRSKLITSDITNINRINYDLEPENIIIELDKFGIDFLMKRVVNNEYMDIKALYMLWFYMYYMDAKIDENNQPCLNPVYIINIGNAEFPQKCKIITDKILYETNKIDIIDSEIDSDMDINLECSS